MLQAKQQLCVLGVLCGFLDGVENQPQRTQRTQGEERHCQRATYCDPTTTLRRWLTFPEVL
jgi:hypothetical protein